MIHLLALLLICLMRNLIYLWSNKNSYNNLLLSSLLDIIIKHIVVHLMLNCLLMTKFFNYSERNSITNSYLLQASLLLIIININSISVPLHQMPIMHVMRIMHVKRIMHLLHQIINNSIIVQDDLMMLLKTKFNRYYSNRNSCILHSCLLHHNSIIVHLHVLMMLLKTKFNLYNNSVKISCIILSASSLLPVGNSTIISIHMMPLNQIIGPIVLHNRNQSINRELNLLLVCLVHLIIANK